MGKGTMKRKNYITKQGYYLSKDFDVKVGGDFYFLLLPLYGNDNQCFFYVFENEDGSYTVEGECYIITNNEHLKRYIKEAKKEFSDKPIWYYHTDNNHNTVYKEMIAP